MSKSSARFRDCARYAWHYWRTRPGFVGVLVCAMLAVTLCDLLMPIMAGRLIDAIAESTSSPRDWRTPATAVAVIVGLSLAFFGLRNLAYQLWVRLAVRVMRELVSDAFFRVQRFSADWHASSFAGATVRKITRGMWAYDLFADTLYVGLFPAAIVLTGMTSILLWRWPLMGTYVLVAVLLYVSVSLVLLTRYVAPANQRENDADSALGAALADAVSCNATVKAFGRETAEDRRFGRVADRWRRRARRSWVRQINTELVQLLLSVLLQLGLLGMVVWFWYRGEASPGDVTFVMTSYFLINGYLRETGSHVRHLRRSMDEMSDIIGFQAQPFGVEDAPTAVPLAARRGVIAFDRVTFGYERQMRPLYRNFDLRIEAGERIALVGHSGSGKSTFVKLLQRFYDLQGGAISIDGQDIAGVTQASLRQAIAVVPQEALLFHRSLAENIAYARPDASQAEIETAARLAHAHDFIVGLKDGYGTLVGERGVKLSGGERQRVAIARAFLADAPVLVLDEATSSLDALTEMHIQAAIERLIEGRTTIVIAHRLSTVRQVDRILVFENGEVIEQGRHDELMQRLDGAYRKLFTRQMAAE